MPSALPISIRLCDDSGLIRELSESQSTSSSSSREKIAEVTAMILLLDNGRSVESSIRDS